MACLCSTWTHSLHALSQVLRGGGSVCLEDCHAFFFPSVKPFTMQKGPISGQAIMMHSPLLMFQLVLNKSLGFYCKGTKFEVKISKTSFPFN